MKMTIAKFAESQNVTAHVANGFMAFLVEKGLATKTSDTALDSDGKGKRGRPSSVYEFSDTITVSLG